MTREMIKPDPVVVSQNTPPASPNVKAPTVEDLVEEATKENTEEEPKDKALTVEDLEAKATEENTEEDPRRDQFSGTTGLGRWPRRSRRA